MKETQNPYYLMVTKRPVLLSEVTSSLTPSVACSVENMVYEGKFLGQLVFNERGKIDVLVNPKGGEK